MAVRDTRERLQRYLTDFLDEVKVDKDGDFHFRHESVEVFATTQEWGEDETVVHVVAPLLFGVKGSPELFEYIARHSDDYLFGHLALKDRDGTFDIHFSHILLGDFLDPEELKSVVAAVAITGNDLDDELQKQFGGERFYEDS